MVQKYTFNLKVDHLIKFHTLSQGSKSTSSSTGLFIVTLGS